MFVVVKKKRYKSYKGEVGKVAPNLLQRNFKANKPNELWATDVTEFSTTEGKLYLSPIKDLYTHEIISFAVSEHPDLRQVKYMLDVAFEKHVGNLKNIIFHSDQGWQYQHKYYQSALKKHEIRQSMSRKGNCIDNGAMESFFGVMKNEMYYGREEEFETIKQLEKAIIEYIEYYNNERIQIGLKGMSPIQYRRQAV